MNSKTLISSLWVFGPEEDRCIYKNPICAQRRFSTTLNSWWGLYMNGRPCLIWYFKRSISACWMERKTFYSKLYKLLKTSVSDTTHMRAHTHTFQLELTNFEKFSWRVKISFLCTQPNNLYLSAQIRLEMKSSYYSVFNTEITKICSCSSIQFSVLNRQNFTVDCILGTIWRQELHLIDGGRVNDILHATQFNCQFVNRYINKTVVKYGQCTVRVDTNVIQVRLR